jgi:hypothetical protein
MPGRLFIFWEQKNLFKERRMNRRTNASLKFTAFFIVCGLLWPSAAPAAELEKDELTLGFIKLTDCAPIVIAKEKGFFEEEGLFVRIEAQANWKTLMDRVIDGELDGSHMLAPAPLGHTAGILTKSHIVVPYVMSVNGAGISVSKEVWEKMKPNLPLQEDGKPVHPIGADKMKPVVDEFKSEGRAFKMAMTYPVGVHNYVLRYWLAAGGLNPAAPDAGRASGGHRARDLRQRSVASAGGRQGRGRSRHLEPVREQRHQRQGVRRHQGMGRKESEFPQSGREGPDPRRKMAG